MRWGYTILLWFGFFVIAAVIAPQSDVLYVICGIGVLIAYARLNVRRGRKWYGFLLLFAPVYGLFLLGEMIWWYAGVLAGPGDRPPLSRLPWELDDERKMNADEVR